MVSKMQLKEPFNHACVGMKRIEMCMRGKGAKKLKEDCIGEPNERMHGVQGMLFTTATNTLGISDLYKTLYAPVQRVYDCH